MLDEKIKYYEEDSWKHYFNNDLANLYASVEGFINLREEIKANLEGRPISSIINEKPFYKSVFFGGLQGKEDKPFVDNALARFYWEVLGIGIDRDAISTIIARMKDGLTLESAITDISCSVVSTNIVLRLSELYSKLQAIFKMLRGVVEKPAPKRIEVKDESFGLEALRSILNAGKAILPLYNPISFFVNSLYSIPYFYAKEAYPKLFEESTINLLKKYGLQLVDLLEPDVPDNKIREERKIIGWADGSVGVLIREVILDVYSLFSMDVVSSFFNIENEFYKYVRSCIDLLRGSIVKDLFSNVISKIESVSSTESLDEKGRCQLPPRSGLTFRYSVGYGKHDGYHGVIKGGEVGIGFGHDFEHKEYKMSYSEFIAFLAPQMLLGLAYIRPITKNRFSWLCITGWL
ncbi:hypothetical protein [Pyrodictium occultum]|uniref:hypothetical protein n=1 Tax=Pyrodictium occultum TaxID=2309 RepID=UPI0014438C9D|nr:hypothetical protein [Pyrodictium occultum]